ncbi:hypothetical protein BUALT_Bualt07G0117000 [Buddleja alternifolia]|uniref:Uncharacterized protein n=1 Tax=Buddleja alternifolia TaxID=168488 RepID=A0AAV6XGJ5_9LAMI|nr:hypothetical protein BUALT_Bualt07G0117000 [Buddleja alternifolia]
MGEKVVSEAEELLKTIVRRVVTTLFRRSLKATACAATTYLPQKALNILGDVFHICSTQESSYGGADYNRVLTQFSEKLYSGFLSQFTVQFERMYKRTLRGFKRSLSS